MAKKTTPAPAESTAGENDAPAPAESTAGENDAPAPAESTAGESAPVETIKMVRDTAPFTADVHPAEIENFKLGGWVVAK